MEKEYLTVKDVSDILGIGSSTAYKFLNSNICKKKINRMGRKITIKESNFRDIMKQYEGGQMIF